MPWVQEYTHLGDGQYGLSDRWVSDEQAAADTARAQQAADAQKAFYTQFGIDSSDPRLAPHTVNYGEGVSGLEGGVQFTNSQYGPTATMDVPGLLQGGWYWNGNEWTTLPEASGSGSLFADWAGDILKFGAGALGAYGLVSGLGSLASGLGGGTGAGATGAATSAAGATGTGVGAGTGMLGNAAGGITGSIEGLGSIGSIGGTGLTAGGGLGIQGVIPGLGEITAGGMFIPAAGGAAVSLSTASPSLLSSIASGIKSVTGLDITPSQIASGALSAVGGLLSGNAAQDAAQTSANAQLEAARIAADAAKFKPVGVTTNFGQSTFQKDAQGNVIGAGYTLSPQLKALQDQLLGAAPGMLNQFTGSQATTAPMGTAAQAAMNLGNQYLAISPQAQAQKYYDEQQAVMAAQRERDRVNLENRLAAQGRLGLATGGTSSGMMAANPEMEALYNAQRQQDLQLAAAATQGGMGYAKFGTGMVGAGGDLLKSMYGAQTAAFSPYQTALGGAQTIEGLGQNALDLSINLGKVASPAQSGQLLAQGMLGAAQTMQPSNAYSPWGALLSGAGNAIQNWQNQTSQQQAQQQMLNAIWGK